MPPLKDLIKTNRRGQDSLFETKGRERSDFRSSGFRENRRDDRRSVNSYNNDEKVDLFVPGLSEEM